MTDEKRNFVIEECFLCWEPILICQCEDTYGDLEQETDMFYDDRSELDSELPESRPDPLTDTDTKSKRKRRLRE